MCVVKSCTQPAGESPARENTTGATWARYRVLGVASRDAGLSVDRNCAGRNALSGVKVSSPDNILRGGRPIMEQGMQHFRVENESTTGVQVHGMYRGLSTKHKRSVLSRGNEFVSCPRVHAQGLKAKRQTILETEVRSLHSSVEVG